MKNPVRSLFLGAMLSLSTFWEQVRHSTQMQRARSESLRPPSKLTPPIGGTAKTSAQFRFGPQRHTLKAHNANLMRCQGHTKDSARIIAGLTGKCIAK